MNPLKQLQQHKAVETLGKSRQPIVRIEIDDVYQLGQEFFRWEIATAVAGSIIGINAFNQPDVEASKEVIKLMANNYKPCEQKFAIANM